MLDVKQLTTRYGKHTALHGVDLRIKPGEIVVILGANGAGKSSLLRAIAGISEGQVAGSVTMDGEELVGMPAHQVVERGVALVPEGRGIFGDLTVRENLILGGNPERARDDVAATYDRLIGLFPKLADRAGQIARTMSGGEQQMVAIGRAMMSNPRILMLDEPSLGLSPLLSKELFQSLKAVKAAGLGVLLVEQNARLSLGIADRGYLIENGRILREDRAEILRTDPAVQAAYLGGASGGKTQAVKPHVAPAAPVTPAQIAAQALAAPAPAQPVITPRPKSTRTIPAEEVLGFNIKDVLHQAATAYQPAQAPIAAHALPQDRLQAALRGIEEAARGALTASHHDLPPLRPTARPHAAAVTPAPPPPPSATFSAPLAPAAQGARIEVWHRGAATTFHNSET